jgi:hypothetical protein
MRLVSGVIRQCSLCFAFISVFCLAGETTNAQSIPKACSQIMSSIAGEHVAANNFSDLRGASIVCFWELALPQLSLAASRKTQAAIQKNAGTMQTGAPAGTNGSTSAVSKPLTPLSLATEYGGITSSTKNQTITLQTPLDGIPAAFAAKGLVGYCWSPLITIPSCVSASRLQWLNRISLGITANTTTSSQSVMGTASASSTTAQPASLNTAGNTAPSVASTFVKFNLWRGKYVPGSQTLPGKAVDDAQEKITMAVGHLVDAGADFKSWSTCVQSQFTADHIPDPTAQKAQFLKYWVQILDVVFGSSQMNCSSAVINQEKHIIDLRPTAAQLEEWKKQVAANAPSSKLLQARIELIDAVDNYLAAVQVFEAQADELLKASAPVLSVEYDYNTPVNQPTTSTVKMLFSYSAWKAKCPSGKGDKATNTPTSFNRLTATLNAGADLYNSAPSAVPGAGAFRDAQVGSEVDLAFCTSTNQPIWSFLSNGTVGLTYYYQDQVSPSILKVASAGMPLPGINITGLDSSATQVFTKKGVINFVQLKYGFGVGKNVKFPLAVSWSNRTDLITHPAWSAQFGVSYDFSSLLNSSSGGSTQ